MSLGLQKPAKPRKQIWGSAIRRRFLSEATCCLAPKRKHVRAFHITCEKAGAEIPR